MSNVQTEKRVLSVSLGSSRRDKTVVIELLGQRIRVERRGTDGDLELFARLLREADGCVDVLCIGGANLALHWRGRRYVIRDVARAIASVRRTPVVDGSRVKDTLERDAVRWVHENIQDLRESRILLACAVDRFGMADELRHLGAKRVICGDLIFDVGIPIAIGFRAVDILAPLCLPLLTRLPFRWLYPTGQSQDEIRPKGEKWFRWAEVVAGDFLIIRRHMPDDLRGKLLITNSTTQEDLELLRQRGLRAVVTTSLRVEGRSFGTNVLEGILIVLADRPVDELTKDDLRTIAQEVGWQPELIELAHDP
ncbi:MAG: quinate 5-dehydrogenase [Armatimonadetes bacterium]|nr:quinate 5-dehydrogenase [Armatimonadota bacterium]